MLKTTSVLAKRTRKNESKILPVHPISHVKKPATLPRNANLEPIAVKTQLHGNTQLADKNQSEHREAQNNANANAQAEAPVLGC